MTTHLSSAEKSSALSSAALGALGILLMLASWELVGQTGALGRAWPPFSEVVEQLIDDYEIFRPALANTFTDAAIGFVIGMALGLSLALTGLLIPPIRAGMGRFATVINSIPWVALGPLLVMLLSPKRAPVIFAVMGVFFSSFIAISSGFQHASPAHHDLLTVLGSSRRSRFRRLELPVAVPSIIYGAKLGAPAAMFGVIFGEWFGTTDPSLGLLIVTSLQQFITNRLWAAAFVSSLIAIAAFGIFAALERGAIRRFR